MKAKFLIFLGIITTFISCSKEDDNCNKITDIYYNIPDSIKNLFPYSGSEKIAFVNNNNDTVNFIGQGKTNIYQSFERQSSLGNIDCPKTERILSEYLSTKFTGDKIINSLVVNFFKSEEDGNFEKRVRIETITNNKSIGLSIVSNLSDNILDSIYFNGNYEVGFYMCQTNKITLLNYKYGVLKFEYPTGVIWTKIK